MIPTNKSTVHCKYEKKQFFVLVVTWSVVTFFVLCPMSTFGQILIYNNAFSVECCIYDCYFHRPFFQILGLITTCILICRTRDVKYDRLENAQRDGLRVWALLTLSPLLTLLAFPLQPCLMIIVTSSFQFSFLSPCAGFLGCNYTLTHTYIYIYHLLKSYNIRKIRIELIIIMMV